MALVFASRCIFESVMESYYVMPLVVMLLVLAARRRFLWAVTLAAGLYLTRQAFSHLSPWHYFLEMTGLMLVMLAASVPTSLWRKPSDDGVGNKITDSIPVPAPDLADAMAGLALPSSTPA